MDWFNADNRAADLNFGSFRGISPAIRRIGVILIEQAHQVALLPCQPALLDVQKLGLQVDRRIRATESAAIPKVAVGSVEESIHRIMERSYRGGHSASERLVKDIYENSTRNLLTALDFAESGIDVVRIYDNSEVGVSVKHVLNFIQGRLHAIANEIPDWVESLFRGTKFDIARLRATPVGEETNEPGNQ